MENIQIKNKEGETVVEFIGFSWIINGEEVPGDPDSNQWYFFERLEQLDDYEDIVKKLSKKSPKIKKLFDDYYEEHARLNGRTILYEQYGEGAVDTFTDILAISLASNGDIFVETSVEGDPYDFEVNALGELMVERVGGIQTAQQLYDGIKSVLSDHFDRWSNIDWEWREILGNLKDFNSELAVELEQIIKQKEIK